MNVPSVPNALTGLASQLKHGAISDIKAAAGKVTAAAQSSLPTATAAMRGILSKYDITDITPSDFSNLIQQLSAKGTISPKDAQELSSINVDLANAGISPDQSVNLLDFYEQQIANAQAGAAQSPAAGAAQANLTQLVGRMKWLAKFAAASQQDGQSGVNAVA